MAYGGIVFARIRSFWTTPRGILVAGLVVREVLSFWTGHPFDLEVWIRNAYVVAFGQNPYDHFLAPVQGLSFAYLQDSIPSVGYLPAWSLLVAGLYRVYILIPGTSRFVFYFMLKQPTVLADMGLGFLILRSIQRWGGTEEISRNALRAWLFLPYPIVIGAIWGQFDAIVVDMILLFALSSSWSRQYGFLGVGILLKWFPVVLLPFLALRERWLRKPGALLALAIPVAFTFALFWIMGWDYVGVTGMAQYTSHGNIGGITFMSLLGSPLLVRVLSQVPDFYNALGYLWVPGILVGGYWSWRRFPERSPQATIQGFLLATTVFFLTRQGVNEQYVMYLLPLLLIDVSLWHPERRGLFHLTWILCFAFQLVNNDLLIRFLGPVNSTFVDIANATDASPVLGPIRAYTAYLLDIFITLTFVQLVRSFMNPKSNARPWPSILASAFRSYLLGRQAAIETDE
jgi:hypothetical protein